MFVYLEKSYIFALLLFGCKNPSVRNVFSISFPLRVLMSKFFFSVFISVVLTSLETQLVLSKNPHHSMVRIFCDYSSLLTVYSLQMIGKAYCINFSTALLGSALKVPAGRLAMIAFIESAWCPKSLLSP